MRNWRTRFFELDPILLLALLAAFAFSLHGIRWGLVEDWNPDEMAMRRLSITLEPHEYLKPPFYIFVNHVVVLWPLEIVEAVGRTITHRVFHLDEAKLLLSRLLMVAFYLGTIVLGYKTARVFYGQAAARVIALLLATSAGFFAYVHFLTADIPVIACMMLAFWFASRIVFAPSMRNYVAAGLCVGLATATKYNGLAVGIAIPVAHLLSRPWSWRALLPDRRIIVGLVMVPIGFLLGNPHALFHWANFSRDFVYNYEVTPRYGGEEGIGFGKFGEAIFSILGLPGGILVALLVVISILLLVRPRRKTDALAAKGFILCASVFVLYALKMGSFPRVPVRFVLPAVPFLILMIGPAYSLRPLRSAAVTAVLAVILLYNSVCSIYVGKRFRDDPRTAAQLWVKANVRAPARIESTSQTPHWSMLPGVDAVQLTAGNEQWGKVKRRIADIRMPHPNTRAALFSRVFAGNERVVQEAQRREHPPDESLFTLATLQERSPDYIAVHSGDYAPPIDAVRKYYDDLLNERCGYKKVFDVTSRPAPRWIYPQEIDFLRVRMTILARSENETIR